MVEAFSSGLEASSLCLNNGLAEAAPEPALTVAPNSAEDKPALDLGWIRYCMVFGYVCPKLLATVTGLATAFIWVESAWLVAFPQLELTVLAILVTLPVVLTAKSFWALWKSAAVWLFVPFLVLPSEQLSEV